MNKALKIAIGNANLQLAIADLAQGSRRQAQMTPTEMRQLSPADRLMARNRRKNLAIQMAKKSLKKS